MSADRRSSYASVAAGTAQPSHPVFSPPRGAGSGQQQDDPDSSSSTPQHNYSRTRELGNMASEHVKRSEFESAHTAMDSTIFVPSYLRRSRHMERVEAAQKQRQQHIREVRPQQHTHTGLISRQPSSTNLVTLKTSAISVVRSTTHDVIERLPPLQPEDLCRPLPSRWNDSDKCLGLDVAGDDGLEIKYQGGVRATDDAATVRSDHAMPKECGLYYYEVTILSRNKEGLIGIGFSGSKSSLNRLPGWEQESWGYHGDDGYSFACSPNGKPYGPKFQPLDVIGCGVNFRTGTAFFTRNGILLGDAFSGIKMDRLYPSVGVKKAGEHLRANFGQKPFVFDIDSLMERERLIVQQEIERTDLSRSPLRQGLNETETIHELISQYLAHEGFIDTANQFNHDIKEQGRTLESVDGISTPPLGAQDVDAIHRQKIRGAILQGSIDQAFKYLGVYFPHVLEQDSNRDIYFRLRCRKFIELILLSYGAQGRSSPSDHSESGLSNDDDEGGANLEPEANGMDVDGQSIRKGKMGVSLEAMDTSVDMLNPTSTFVETRSATVVSNDLLTSAIQYGMELQAEFNNDPRKEVKDSLSDTFALLAYTDARDSVLADIMEGKGRVEIAEQVNGAILVSLGKPRSALLERLCAQTEVLLEMLRDQGGAGAFVNLQQDYMH